MPQGRKRKPLPNSPEAGRESPESDVNPNGQSENKKSIEEDNIEEEGEGEKTRESEEKKIDGKEASGVRKRGRKKKVKEIGEEGLKEMKGEGFDGEEEGNADSEREENVGRLKKRLRSIDRNVSYADIERGYVHEYDDDEEEEGGSRKFGNGSRRGRRKKNVVRSEGLVSNGKGGECEDSERVERQGNEDQCSTEEEPMTCHQCKRNDKGRVVRCNQCERKRFCIPCITNW